MDQTNCMRHLFFVAFIILLYACNNEGQQTDTTKGFNQLAERYVRLGLLIGQYDEVFVDAYYGPDSLKPSGRPNAVFPKDSILSEISKLQEQIAKYKDGPSGRDSLQVRALWMEKQLRAFSRRVKWFSGEKVSFDEEAGELFDVRPPVYDEAHFQKLIHSLDSLVPGPGSIRERVLALSKEFIIPKDKVDTVFKAAYFEAKKRTRAKLSLPDTESFRFEYVTNKSWSGYNWYKGNYQSLIQQNLDLPIAIERAIDLACHEGYPGHHVYNMLLEKNLYRERGWVEVSLYPLYSPQSLIAEGSANYGIEMAFPGKEKTRFAKDVLFPLAGLDTTKANMYFGMLEIKQKLNYARNEAARQLLNGSLNDSQASKWMMDYMLVSKEQADKYVSFIKANHSYVICYNYGQDLVKHYIESRGGTASEPDRRWQLFQELLSNPVTPQTLLSTTN